MVRHDTVARARELLRRSITGRGFTGLVSLVVRVRCHVPLHEHGQSRTLRMIILTKDPSRLSIPPPPLPPFDQAAARQKVLAAEAAWNTRNPDRVAVRFQYQWHCNGTGIPLR